MGQIKTSISIEENVSSAFKSMNTVVNSTLKTFQNFDNVINDTPTMSNKNETILNSINNASDSVKNSINDMNNTINSVGTINSNNISTLNAMTTETENASQSVQNLNNDINNLSNTGYWTNSVGNYSKSALEAIYTTEELVEMGFKSADALKTQENSVNQVNNAVSNLKNNISQWSEVPNIEIFNSSGMERYEQEISSAQDLINKLVQNQVKVQSQANNTSFISSTALEDLNNVNNRIIRLQTSMQELENKKITAIGADEVNPEIEELRQKINNALESQKDLNEAMQKMDANKAYSAYEKLNQNIRDAENEVSNFNNRIDDMNDKINNATKSSNSLFKTLMGFSIVQKIIGVITNQLDSAIKRMDTMTNFKKTMTAITGSSDAATASLEELKSITKGTAYGLDTAANSTQNFVTRGMGIASATREVGKWADAVSFYGDGTNEQLASVTDALGKMLTKGTVEMDQLNRITDAGINAVGIYAQATGQSTATVQKNLSAGKISAYDFITTVSTAFEEGTNGVLNISGAAKNAGATWATTIANMKAAVTRGIVTLIDSINNALTKAGFGTILDGVRNFGETMEVVLGNIGNFIGGVITLLSPLFSLIQQMGAVIYDNWSIIEPIILGIAAALAIYYGAQLAANAISAISTGIHMAMAVAQMMHAAATGGLTAATAAQIAAQNGLNAALYACPLVWILIIIIAIIAAIYAVVAAINKITGSSISATGVIVGALTTAVAFIWNLFLSLLDLVLAVINAMVNPWISFANFFANLFNDPIGAIVHLFGDMADSILGILESIAKAIDKVFGSNLAGAVQGWRSGLNGMVEKVANEYGNGGYEKVAEELNLSSESLGLSRWSYGDAWNTGYSWGEGIETSIGDMFSMPSLDTSSIPGLENYETSDMANNIADTANNTGKVADSMDITEEDLKYLRDIAEQEVVNRFTAASINVEMNNNNNISSDADLDGIVSGLEDKIYEMANSMAEGVHN